MWYMTWYITSYIILSQKMVTGEVLSNTICNITIKMAAKDLECLQDFGITFSNHSYEESENYTFKIIPPPHHKCMILYLIKKSYITRYSITYTYNPLSSFIKLYVIKSIFQTIYSFESNCSQFNSNL